MNWTVYLLRCADETQYCGITTDMNRRLDQHNQGRGAKYTRSRRPVSLLECALFPNKSIALKVECAIKKQPRTQKRETLLYWAQHYTQQSS